MPKPLLLAVALLATSQDPGVAIAELEPGRFELTVTVEGAFEPGRAQSALTPTARRLCGDQGFTFGRYAFKGDERLGDAATRSVTLVQEVACGRQAQPARPDPAPRGDVAAKTAALNPVVLALSEDYFDAAASGRLIEAARHVADDMMGGDVAGWIEDGERLVAELGAPGERQFVKVTWYVDPAGAPEPGYYAAVDYVADWAESEECGYLVWYAPEPDQTFRLVRQERAQLARNLAPDQRAAARQQYCILL